jgi:hypothetical protein
MKTKLCNLGTHNHLQYTELHEQFFLEHYHWIDDNLKGDHMTYQRP